MAKLVVLLRAVNVAGHGKLPMAELRDTVERVGLGPCRTLLQSGNLVLDDPDPQLDPALVAARLSAALRAGHGLDTTCVARTDVEWRTIAATEPFAELGLDPKLVHVVVCDHAPSPDAVASAPPDPFPPDRYVVDGAEVHVAYPGGSGRSKLTLAWFERHLDVVGTGRNRNTVAKLAAMLDD